MAYEHLPIELAAGQLVEAAIPRNETPSRFDRLTNFENAQSALSRLCVDTVFGISKNNDADHNVIVPMGIYATREVLYSLAQKDKVDFSEADKTSHELQSLSTFLLRKINFHNDGGKTLGFAAELGVANMIWAGIADAELGLSYAALLGINGYEKDHNGPKGDIDLIVRHSGAKKNSGKVQLQIKASSSKSKAYYKDGIKVITAQDLVNKETPIKSVVKLLNWKAATPEEKNNIYERFNQLIQ